MRVAHLASTGIVVMLSMLSHAQHDVVADLQPRQLILPFGGRWRGPKNEAKVGSGDRFQDGKYFPRGASVRDAADNTTARDEIFESILNFNEISSAMQGLHNEYGIQLVVIHNATTEGRDMTLGLIPCNGQGNFDDTQCGMPTSYKVLFLAAVHGRERSSPDSIIYFLSDLLHAQKHETGLSYGVVDYTHEEVLNALSLGIAFVPVGNPDGLIWDHEEYSCWRRNRNSAISVSSDPSSQTRVTAGVDIDRNFPFAFDYTRYLNVTGARELAVSDDILSEMYQGPAPSSEPETQGIAWLFDALPGVGWLMDIRTNGRRIRFPWSLDLIQSDYPEQNWRNTSYDGQRGDTWNENYREYMDASDHGTYRNVSGRLAKAMNKVANTSYSSGETAYLYQTTGDLMSWSYARHIVNPGHRKVMSFALDFGDADAEAQDKPDEICQFYPGRTNLSLHMRESAVGYMEFLLAVADNEATSN